MQVTTCCKAPVKTTGDGYSRVRSIFNSAAERESSGGYTSCSACGRQVVIEPEVFSQISDVLKNTPSIQRIVTVEGELL